MERPNILFVMADQLAPHFTSTYGHEVVQTPNLDALAERGTRFDTAYCHSPLCAPARFTMLSGRTVSEISAWARPLDNADSVFVNPPTVTAYMHLVQCKDQVVPAEQLVKSPAEYSPRDDPVSRF